MKKIAVIGAGPAGCSAAYHLRAAGVDVDLFDKSHQKLLNCLQRLLPEARPVESIRQTFALASMTPPAGHQVL